MKLVDTHTHLYLPEFDSDRDEMVSRAVGEGIIKMLMPNIDLNSIEAMLIASKRFHGICYPMIGLHPTSVKEDYVKQLDYLESIFSENDYVAIGEIGIDLYWDKTHLREQTLAMRRQVEFAIRKNLPVVIHSRDSFPEVFMVLEEFRGEVLKGVLHAFSGTIGDARKAVEMGFMLGIGGPLTFRNSNLYSIVKETGIDHLLLETDSPYLAPVPYRGKRNESSYIRIINNKLADVLGISEEECARITYENSCSLFKI